MDLNFDERAAAGVEHLGAEAARRYDAKAQFDPAGEIQLLRRLALDHDSTLVDIGAGTGTLALAAARFCRRVVAVDPSPAMLAVLEEKAAHAQADNIELVEAGFLSYQHVGAPADVVFSRNALHHLPDFWKTRALARAASILRRGGTLRLIDLVYSFEPHEADAVLAAWISAAPADGDNWTRTDLERHVRSEHSTFAWLLEPMLERAGFVILEREYEASRVFARYVAVRAE